jgi:hypothetical protein
MQVSGAMGIAAQEMAANKTQAGYDVLTKTLQKTQQNEQNAQQRMAVAEQTGKGLNIDVKA